MLRSNSITQVPAMSGFDILKKLYANKQLKDGFQLKATEAYLYGLDGNQTAAKERLKQAEEKGMGIKELIVL